MMRSQRTGPQPASAPTTDEDGVRLPRLRFKDVVVRGAVHGVAAVVLLAVGSLLVADHHDRETFVAVIGGFSMVGAGVCLVFGGFFWAVSGRDVRRWRDWRTIKGQTEGVTVMGPALVRTGVLALVLFPGAYGLYHLIDIAPYDSFLYGS
ncbi:DUF6336 family protein [Streptomyces sp. NPDC006283]|uniref:DUF6336 family protein n=1 Tax=Streptomyces sp. NPDC006283 TaxID=3156741 RepID=UPI0033ABDC1E